MADPLDTGTDTLDAAYRVHLDEFEGPLDLLLHLIKKNEINIYDIPIAVITKQYLDYISLLKYLNLEVAGEFLVMAATLIHIKSRMLLPAETEGDEDEEGGEDPRAELVRRLLEYKQFKEAAAGLVERREQWRDVYGRPAFFERGQVSDLSPNEEVDEASLELTLFDLVDAFQDIVQRTPAQAFVEVTPDHLTVKDRMNYILERLEYEAAIPFESLFVPEEGRLVLIVTFLGLLELVRIKLIRAYQAEAFGAILLSRAFLPATAGDAEPEEIQP